MKFKKGLAAAIAAAALLTSSVSVTAYADTSAVHGRALNYELLAVAVPTLSFDGNTAYCESSVDGDMSVVKTTVVQRLQKYWGLWVWNDVDGAEWTKTEYDYDVDIFETFDVSESGKYRVELEITMEDENGTTETVTVYSKEVDVTL